jgi:glucose/arabinose dehydrogenase
MTRADPLHAFEGLEGGDEVNIVERGKNYGWPIIHHTQT